MQRIAAALSGIRRALFTWQWAALVVVPTWIVVGWSVFGATRAGGIDLTPALLVLVALAAQTVLAVLITLRRSVRRERALSWSDAAVLAVGTGELIAAGFDGPATGTFIALALVAYAVGFWVGAVELVREVRVRVRGALDALGLSKRPVQGGEYVVLQGSAGRTQQY